MTRCFLHVLRSALVAVAGFGTGGFGAAPQISIDQGGTVSLNWHGENNAAYWVQGSTALDEWMESGFPDLGTNTAIGYTDPAPPSARGFYRLRTEPVLDANNFAGDPRAAGWTYADFSRFVDTTGGLGPADTIRPGGKIWRTAPFDRPPFEYYRIDFRVRSDGALPARIWVSGLGLYSTTTWGRFFAQGGFNASDPSLWDDDWAVFPVTADWKSQIYYTRVRANAATSAALFWGFDSTDAIIDAVVVTPASRIQARDWADAVYGNLPALDYIPQADRHNPITRTLPLLDSGATVRMVFVGDSLVQDLANSMIDLLLERAYPGSRVELITAGASSTGMDQWNSLAASSWPAWRDIDLMAAVIEQQPDLVLLGGISNGNDWNTHFPGVIDKIRSQCLALHGYEPDILIATGPLFSGSPPAGMIADLETIAATEGCGFLDLHAAFDAYLSSLPAGWTPADFRRDSVHANQQGKQIFGRILLEWFLPDDP